MLDHPRDLAADFRAVYHLSPAEAMALPGPEYLALAYRLPAYPGVMKLRAEAEQDERRSRIRRGREVDSTRSAILADRDLAQVVSFG